MTGCTPTTGLPDLDALLCGVSPGDNVVWEVSSPADYAAFVNPFVAQALREREAQPQRALIYFRFARHAPLIGKDVGFRIIELEPHAGFEAFLDATRAAISEGGGHGRYLFDCMSDLSADWFSDQMVGNFFQLVCPFILELGGIAYFALLRNTHSPYAINPITETTQMLLEVYRHQGRIFVQPQKVQGRCSPAMYTLHEWQGDQVRPVRESHEVAEVLTSVPRAALGVSQYRLGVWTRTFGEAERLHAQSQREAAPPDAVEAMFERLLRMMISRDERMLGLARRYLQLGDLVSIGKRMLGTGLIGGKSVGMLLARAILLRSDPRWKERLAMHDSFFVPSDVFYTYLVRNGCWEIRKRQLQSRDYLHGAQEARERIRRGVFPDHLRQRFAAMLDYFGQSPIIVRSSSLLEDNFGNSFAGKYDSVFCTNQGPPEQRLVRFLDAVKTIYASTMSEAALSYRARHGLLARDEQMALLVQRVSGAHHGRYHYPHLAGVGFSFNPYVWDRTIDPKAGVLRLVFGLGTRAVDRSDEDYTRLVALNAPHKRPEHEKGDTAGHAQQRVDVLDLHEDRFDTILFRKAVEDNGDLPLKTLATRDRTRARLVREQGLPEAAAWMLTFDGLFADTPFVDDMRALLQTIEAAYENPVDIEFAANLLAKGGYRIDLVQCRPLQVRGDMALTDPPADLPGKAVFVKTHGPVIGPSRSHAIDRFVYVSPAVYGILPERDRHAVARLIGRINQHPELRQGHTMLMGPGRWGTTTPSLGVPVSFAEINRMAVLCEIVAMRKDLVPDVSFATHFFAEMVEMNLLYMAIFPNQPETRFDMPLFEEAPSRTREFAPDAAGYENAVRVVDAAALTGGPPVILRADTLHQEVLCYAQAE